VGDSEAGEGESAAMGRSTFHAEMLREVVGAVQGDGLLPVQFPLTNIARARETRARGYRASGPRMIS
jgi:hypothetical protein